MSVVDAGDGKSLIAPRYFGSGSIVLSDTLKPAKLALFSANWNLSGFKTIPAWPTRLSSTSAAPSQSRSVWYRLRSAPSVRRSIALHQSDDCSHLLMKESPGMLLCIATRPNGVMNVVRWRSELAQGDTMVAIPGVRYRISCVFGDTPVRDERVSPLQMFFVYKICSVVRGPRCGEKSHRCFRVMTTAVGTRSRGSPYGTRSITPSASSRRRSSYTHCCQCRGYVGGRVARLVCSSGVIVDFDWRPFHTG